MVQLAIPVETGREYRVTQKGVNSAHELTQQIWNSREDLRQTIARVEFDKLSFTAIGQALRQCIGKLLDSVGDGDDEVPESFFREMADQYTTNLQQLSAKIRTVVDRHIPCHLFHSDQHVAGFSIGPVEFLPRSDWVTRYVKNPDELGYIRDVQAGAMPMAELREMALSVNRERQVCNAWSILRSLRGFEWIATVTTFDHELTQSHKKASIIVGLALDAIGLRFGVDEARRFAMAGRASLVDEDRIATTLDGRFLRGTSASMPGIGGKPGGLTAKMQADKPYYDAVGHILSAYMRGRQSGRAPHLIERWANALYWIGEARREESDFMAVVNYGCAADGLSGAGGEAKLITEFAQTALNPRGDAVSDQHRSISDAVTTVYREGRNKLAHGETPGLFEDLSGTRATGDVLLSALFDVTTTELGSLVADGDPILDVPEKHAYRAFLAKMQKRV
ncbi:hypothetical protein [Paraburkholderia youngii]|uniref:hypothetical protein n=1 Tax=Paraburkholderia youngii TaxID=2782701 RepID=UPI0020CF73B0|nr:hypothetical protein [Paraburkholderia youngii]